jgi:hypothetical protein
MDATTSPVFVENATTTQALLRDIAVQQNDIVLGIGLLIALVTFAISAHAFLMKARLWT